VQALIVGTGYGAAVTALRLTEAGYSVTMLEAGRLWDTPGSDGTIFCKPFMPDGRAMWFQNKTETNFKTFFGNDVQMEVPVEAGVLEARGPVDMRAYQGKGVGGGSLVNMAIYLPPDAERLRRALPMVDQDTFYSKYLPRALATLVDGAPSQRLIDSEFYQYSRVGIAFADKAGFKSLPLRGGYDYGYMEQELDNTVPRSALDGEAGFGNNHGKKSLDKTYLAEALGTGRLTIHALHIVKRIKVNPSGGYVVEVDNIDTKGTVLASKEFTCTHLFVGAGSMATSELLVRARERGDLPNLNAAVGTKWGPNGDIFVALDNPEGSPTGAHQSTVPSHYFVTNDSSDRRVVSEFAPLPVGIPIQQSLIIVVADNPEAGYFKYDASTDKVNLVWSRSQSAPSVAAAKFVFDKINASAGTSYSSVIAFQDGAMFGDTVTYHPVGGVPIGEATDDYGRIKGHAGLYVVDGSLIPIGIGANPSLTISSLAERNIEQVLATDLAG
jgi:cholesterol oxidase